jgi:MFS family permease
VLPLLFAAHGLTVADIGIIKAVYPLTWSAGQLGTGALSDRIGRRPLIASGMVVQAIALALIASGQPSTYVSGVVGAVLLGLGTAMVYPALLAAAADTAMPATRATTVGWYRFWRDLEYPAGAPARRRRRRHVRSGVGCGRRRRAHTRVGTACRITHEAASGRHHGGQR